MLAIQRLGLTCWIKSWHLHNPVIGFRELGHFIQGMFCKVYMLHWKISRAEIHAVIWVELELTQCAWSKRFNLNLFIVTLKNATSDFLSSMQTTSNYSDCPDRYINVDTYAFVENSKQRNKCSDVVRLESNMGRQMAYHSSVQSYGGSRTQNKNKHKPPWRQICWIWMEAAVGIATWTRMWRWQIECHFWVMTRSFFLLLACHAG